MNRTLRHLFMSTSLGVAAVALQAPVGQAEAQDATDAMTCMQDVQALRAQETLSKGGQSVEAWADAAEVACEAGDYGMASAYIADAERRMNLKEAQRDDSGTERAALDQGDTGAAGIGSTGFGGAGLGANDNDDSVADDVGDALDDAGDDVEDVADDVGDEVEDVADDIGDEIDDFADDFNDPDSPTPDRRVMDSIRAAGPEGRTEARGIGRVSTN